MRTKSETKRREILKAAAEVFQEAGFERASMEDIRKHAGFSKATLYSYFASKEELFMEIVLDATETQFQATLDLLDPSVENIERALVEFGTRFLSLLYLTPVRNVRRLVVSESGRSELGKKCYTMGPQRSDAAVAAYLAVAMENGKLRKANATVAAQHLKGLLEAEWIEPIMFEVLAAPEVDALTASVERAVVVFMAAYGPLPASAPGKSTRRRQ